MDSIDRGLLIDLRRNCRITLKELSERHNVTSNAIRKRIASLEKKGVIRKYLIELSRGMVNSDRAFIIAYTDKSVDDDTFAERVFEYPSVTQVHYDSFGSCIIQAEYSGTEQLSDLSTYLRRLDSVTEVEVHTLPIPQGENKPLNNLQLRVLAPLLDNPRMKVPEIAKKSGLTARRVRRTLDDLIESRAVLFTISMTLTATDANFVAFRVQWDSKVISPEQVADFMREKYPNAFWNIIYSALEPIMWCDFVIEHNKTSEEIARDLRNLPSLDLRNTILVYPPKKTRSIRHLALRKMIADAGYL
ncbi:MAG: winged helix-turn-helix transcriptional regulator [Candidatus Thorarchaeota archaeon]